MAGIDLGPLRRAVKAERAAREACEAEMATFSARGELRQYGQLASWPAYQAALDERQAETQALYDALALMGDAPIPSYEDNGRAVIQEPAR